VAHFQPWGCIAFSLIHVKPKNHTKSGDISVFFGYNDRCHVSYRLYSLTKKDFIITNDATFVLTPAQNSSVINKPMSERKVNKIYSELTITVGALATTSLMMYNLSIGPYSCYDWINPIIRYTDDYSLATTGLISIMRGAPDSILNVNNPELVDENDNSITDEQPIVQ